MDPAIKQMRKWKHDRWFGYKPTSSMSGCTSQMTTRSSQSVSLQSDNEEGSDKKKVKKTAAKKGPKKGAKKGPKKDPEGKGIEI